MAPLAGSACNRITVAPRARAGNWPSNCAAIQGTARNMPPASTNVNAWSASVSCVTTDSADKRCSRTAASRMTMADRSPASKAACTSEANDAMALGRTPPA
ncbi:MAG: hypothetical protein Q8L86_07790 [Vicinamibacterales bacterium]|nr:hypothetical protein [Vicinamibacterales bacterium]